MSLQAWVQVAIVLSVINFGVSVVLSWLLWGHLGLLQKIERIWGAWIEPGQLAKPAPMPGSSFLVSDAELAARERTLLAESKRRAQSTANPQSWQFPPATRCR